MHWIFSFLCVPPILGGVFIGYFVIGMWKQAAPHKKKGIPYIGVRLQNVASFLVGRTDVLKAEMDLYNSAKKTGSPVVAVTDFVGQFALLVTDVNLLKNILIKDFDYFVNRRPVHDQESGSISTKFLPAMVADHWKCVRSKLSPAFTTGKIRKMFTIFETSGNKMVSYITSQISTSRELDMSLVVPKYSMDVIANCAFGVDSETWKLKLNERSKFEDMAELLGFRFNGMFFLRFLLITVAPKLATWLGVQPDDVTAQAYYKEVITSVIKHRRETGERQEDFLQLLLDAQEGLLKQDTESRRIFSGDSEPDSKDETYIKTAEETFDDEDVIANSILFIMAGFEPTQTILLFALYCLALEPEAQDKCYEEISACIRNHDGAFCYDGLAEMTYLDSVISETIRLYSPSTRLERACNRDYKVGNIVISKGSVVLVPIHGIHHDSNYFPDPEKFLPERFNRENKSTRNPVTYLPFGHGPRNCLASRFALIKVKTALAQLLMSFQFEPCQKNSIPMEFGRSASAKPKHGMWLKITKRDY